VNKKKQKNFWSLGLRRFQNRAKRRKSFLLLFFKKEVFACFLFPKEKPRQLPAGVF
jgi:hypothetical protein